MGLVVFAKIQGLVKSESPRTFVKTTSPIRIFCGTYYIVTRHHSRFFDCLTHPNLSATLGIDQKWPLRWLIDSETASANQHLVRDFFVYPSWMVPTNCYVRKSCKLSSLCNCIWPWKEKKKIQTNKHHVTLKGKLIFVTTLKNFTTSIKVIMRGRRKFSAGNDRG